VFVQSDSCLIAPFSDVVMHVVVLFILLLLSINDDCLDIMTRWRLSRFKKVIRMAVQKLFVAVKGCMLSLVVVQT